MRDAHGMDGQLPLPDLDKLLEIARLQAVAAAANLEREAVRAARKHRPKAPRHASRARPPAGPRPRRPYLPQDKALRVYATARAQFVEWEQAVRELGLKVTPESIFRAAAGPHPKTQGKVMALHGWSYPRDWPPSTWSKQPPPSPSGQLSKLS